MDEVMDWEAFHKRLEEDRKRDLERWKAEALQAVREVVRDGTQWFCEEEVCGIEGPFDLFGWVSEKIEECFGIDDVFVQIHGGFDWGYSPDTRIAWVHFPRGQNLEAQP